MSNRFNDKVVIVTGGGSGIGKATTLKFANEGARVFILDMDKEAGNALTENITNNGGLAHFYECNVAIADSVETVVSSISSQFDIDILVNNAGIAHVGNIEQCSEQDFERLFNVNVKGMYNMMRAVIPGMKEKRNGVILNLASIASCVGIADRFAYSMSKGAALTMTYSIAKDYIDYGVRCNCIAPARVHTPFVDNFIAQNYPDNQAEVFEKLSRSQPLGRMGKVEEIAGLICYLCSDEAAFITGTNIPIDGGFITLNN